MSTWAGHLPITRARLFSILEAAAMGRRDFSLAERALCTTCEFWAAVAARRLGWYLGPPTADRLRLVGTVLEAIGSPETARTLHEARIDLAAALTPRQRRLCVRLLEERLLESPDPMDALIARFASDIGPSCNNPTDSRNSSEQIAH